MEPSTRDSRLPTTIPPRWRVPLAMLATTGVAMVARVKTIGESVTTDEWNWMARSERFGDSITSGDLASASASQFNFDGMATMPGTPVMWLGSAGRAIWRVTGEVGLHDDPEYLSSRAGLITSQFMVALATSVLIAVLAWLVRRWAGTGPAIVAAVLLATEPWLIGLGSVLHTDELLALFGACGLVMLALALDVPERFSMKHPLWCAAGGGALLIHAPLTKILGLGFGVGAVATIMFALVRDWTRTVDDQPLRTLRLKQVGVAALTAVAILPLSWPALIGDPGAEIDFLFTSIGLSDNPGQMQFFLGETTLTPGVWFYPVTFAFRMTPWLLLGTVIGVPVAFAQRRTRSRAIWLVVWAGPLLIALTTASLKYDRYGLAVFVPLILLVSLGTGPSLERLLHSRSRWRWAAPVAAAFVVVYGLTTVPWGLLYTNPLLGGGERAEEEMLLGWGDGWGNALHLIQELEGGDCSEVTVEGVRQTIFGPIPPARYDQLGWACANDPVRGEPADYVIAYVSQRQLMKPEVIAQRLEGREQVGEVVIRGVSVATIWR